MRNKQKKLLLEIIKEAGQLLLKKTKKATIKKGVGNFLTETDTASEKLIMKAIGKNFPKDLILSEESAPSLSNSELKSNLWIIDPLDGTNNYLFDRATSVVSIAYAEKGQVIIGAVYNPFRDEMFLAEKNNGAYLNNKKIHVSDNTNLSKTSFATDNCYDPKGTRKNLNLVLRINPLPWLSMRGCAALTMCDVALGRFDIYFNSSLKPWDNAAAFLIVEEAGGITLDEMGKKSYFMDSYVLLGNPILVKKCHKLFS